MQWLELCVCSLWNLQARICHVQKGANSFGSLSLHWNVELTAPSRDPRPFLPRHKVWCERWHNLAAASWCWWPHSEEWSVMGRSQVHCPATSPADTSGSGTVTEQPAVLTPTARQPRKLQPVHAPRTARDCLQRAQPLLPGRASCSWVEGLQQQEHWG